MSAAGSRPATPALAQMAQIGADHAAETRERTALVDPRAPQSLVSSSISDAVRRHWRGQRHFLPASNPHRARCTAGRSAFRDFVHCRFADAGRCCVWLRSTTAGIRKPSQERPNHPTWVVQRTRLRNSKAEAFRERFLARAKCRRNKMPARLWRIGHALDGRSRFTTVLPAWRSLHNERGRLRHQLTTAICAGSRPSQTASPTSKVCSGGVDTRSRNCAPSGCTV
jgi:hypothetical protein